MTKNHPQPFSWSQIDRIFLDLDGTLLDKYFDDYFWEEYLPQVYAEKNGVPAEESRKLLLATYKSVENTLDWTDLDRWSEKLDLDIEELKREIDHLVQLHPYVTDFLFHARKKEKELHLVTNAHPKALKVKLEKVKIGHAFDSIVCSQDVGFAKEQVEFWSELEKILPYDRKRTLFVDDTVRVLNSARVYGLKHLVHIAGSSSKLEPVYAPDYISIKDFRSLLF